MDGLVILSVIMIVGPFTFFIALVCSLKILGCLNIHLFKSTTPEFPDDAPVVPRGSKQKDPAELAMFCDSDNIEPEDLNEIYAFRDRWTTGLSGAATLPVHIAITEIPLVASLEHSQITSHLPISLNQYLRQSLNNQVSRPTPNRTCNSSRSVFNSTPVQLASTSVLNELPPPDYNQARLLREGIQAEQLPPPSYNECVKP